MKNELLKKEILIHNDMYYYDLVRENLRKYRKLSNLTQSDISNLTGFSVKYISDIENKTKHSGFTIPTFCKIADVLGINSKDIFTFNINFNKKIKNIRDNNYYYNRTRKNIKKYRISNEVTQETLANKIEVSREFISEIETTNKTFSLATTGRISDVLEIPIDKFFED